VFLPVGADQPHTAARVAGLGAGVVVDPVAASSDDIAAAMRRVLEDGAFRAAALRMRDEYLALPSAADAVARIVR
jgi:glycosyltransferase